MHDLRLEDHLRATLRAEGDALPLTITADELERRHALRVRDRIGRRMALLAAGVAVIAMGSIAALGAGWLRQPAVGGDPTEVPGTDTPSALTLPDLTPPSGAMLLDAGDTDGQAGTTVPRRVGVVPPRAEYRLVITCIGGGEARWSIGQEGEADFVTRGDVPCDGTAAYTDIELGTPPFETIVWVTTDSGNDWRLLITDPVGPPDFIAPLLTVSSEQSLDGVQGTGLATCASQGGSGMSCVVPYFARDGAAEVLVPADANLVFALAEGWSFGTTRFEAVPRAEARADPLAPVATLLGSQEGGASLDVSLATLEQGEWMVRAVVNGSRGGDTFGGVYDIPVVVTE